MSKQFLLLFLFLEVHLSNSSFPFSHSFSLRLRWHWLAVHVELDLLILLCCLTLIFPGFECSFDLRSVLSTQHSLTRMSSLALIHHLVVSVLEELHAPLFTQLANNQSELPPQLNFNLAQLFPLFKISSHASYCRTASFVWSHLATRFHSKLLTS